MSDIRESGTTSGEKRLVRVGEAPPPLPGTLNLRSESFYYTTGLTLLFLRQAVPCCVISRRAGIEIRSIAYSSPFKLKPSLNAFPSSLFLSSFIFEKSSSVFFFRSRLFSIPVNFPFELSIEFERSGIETVNRNINGSKCSSNWFTVRNERFRRISA